MKFLLSFLIRDGGLAAADNKAWRLFLLALFAIFVILRIALLDRSEIWLDEAHTWYLASQPWLDLAEFLSLYDVHPPLYYLLVKFFMILGDAPWVLRLCGLIAELLTLPLIYWSAWMLAPSDRKRAVALVAFVLAGLSANMIFTGLLARSYATLYLSFTMCFAVLSWITTNKEAASRSIFQPAGRKARIPFFALGLGLAAMPWLHNLGLFYSFAVGFVAILVWWMVLDRSRQAFWNFFSAALFALLLYLPHVGVLLRQLATVSSDYWIQQPTLPGLFRALLQIFGHGWDLSPDARVVVGLSALVCIVGLFGVVILAAQRKFPALLVTVGLLATVYAVFFLVTFLVKPVMLNRNMNPMLGPWFVLLALTIGALNRRAIGYAISVFLVGFFATSSWNQYRQEDANWHKKVLHMIVERATGTPTIVTVPNAAAVEIQYHAKQLGLSINIVPLPAAYPANDPSYTFPTGWPGVPAVNRAALEVVDAAISQGDQDVWVYLRSYWIYDPDALLKAHFDKTFCYAPVDGMEKLFIVLRLQPLNSTDSRDCTNMGEEDFFPYDRPEYGLFELNDMEK